MDTDEKATTVRLAFQALLKIIQHAHDMSPSPVSGQLVGMPQEGGILEVTDMFPSASAALADEDDQDSYDVDMLRTLRDVNVDHTAVGWYQSVSLDAPIQPLFVEQQVAYQSAIPNSCFMVYDHLRSAGGPPSVRAFRLQEGYMRAWRDAQRSASGRVPHGLLCDLVHDGVVVELAVSIAVSAVDKLLLASLLEAGELPEVNSVGSENAGKLMLARLAQNLIFTLDDSIAESSRVQHYIRSVGKQQQTLASQLAKRRAENAQRMQNGEPSIGEEDLQLNLKGLSEPPRLGLVVSSSQLGSLLKVCDEAFETLAVKQWC